MSTNEMLRELIAFLEAGYSLNVSLDLLDKMTGDKRICQLKNFLSEGKTLEEAFTKLSWDAPFLEYFVFFLRSSQLKDALQQALDILEMKKNLTRQLKKSLAYPAVLFLFAMLFTFFVSFFLLPQIQSLYVSFNQNVGFWISVYFYVMNLLPLVFLSFAVLLLAYFYYFFSGIKRGNFNIVEKGLGSKWIGPALKEYFSLKFALYYREAAKHSHRLAKTLDLLSKDLFQSDLIMVVYDLRKEIENGTELSQAIQRSIYFTSYFKQVFSLARYASAMDKQLGHYIESALAKIHSKVIRWTKRLVPILYAFSMGTVVSIYLMIILPMMNLASSL